MPNSRFKPISSGDGLVLAFGKKGACRQTRPLSSMPSDDGNGYFNASMPAPKLM
jgi:hypothetical protein